MKCKIKNNGVVVHVSQVVSFDLAKNAILLHIETNNRNLTFDFSSAARCDGNLIWTGIYFFRDDKFTQIAFYPENKTEREILANLHTWSIRGNEIDLIAILFPDDVGEKFVTLFEA